MIQDVMTHIADIVPTLQGWASVVKAQRLAACVIALQAKTVVEIGVFGGRSFIPMALALPALGTIHGIDPWKADASAVGQGEANKKWWGECNHDVIYSAFIDLLAALHIADRCLIQRTTSDQAKQPGFIDLLHIDGNHGPQAVEDAKRWGDMVRVGGLLCLDDIGWEGGHVMAAKEHLLGTGFSELYPLDSGVMLMRTER